MTRPNFLKDIVDPVPAKVALEDHTAPLVEAALNADIGSGFKARLYTCSEGYETITHRNPIVSNCEALTAAALHFKSTIEKLALTHYIGATNPKIDVSQSIVTIQKALRDDVKQWENLSDTDYIHGSADRNYIQSPERQSEVVASIDAAIVAELKARKLDKPDVQITHW